MANGDSDRVDLINPVGHLVRSNLTDLLAPTQLLKTGMYSAPPSSGLACMHSPTWAPAAIAIRDSRNVRDQYVGGWGILLAVWVSVCLCVYVCLCVCVWSRDHRRAAPDPGLTVWATEI